MALRTKSETVTNRAIKTAYSVLSKGFETRDIGYLEGLVYGRILKTGECERHS
jgi:hypothetical protein